MLRSCRAKRTVFTFWCRVIAKHSLTATRQRYVGTGKGHVHPGQDGHLSPYGVSGVPSAASPALGRLVVPKRLVKERVGISHGRNMLAGLGQTIVGDEDVKEGPRGETWVVLGQMVLVVIPHLP